MSSETPGASIEVKEEGTAIPEDKVAAPESLPVDATPTPAIPATETPTPAPTGLSKELTELMNGIVRRLTEYQDQEYVARRPPPIPSTTLKTDLYQPARSNSGIPTDAQQEGIARLL